MQRWLYSGTFGHDGGSHHGSVSKNRSIVCCVMMLCCITHGSILDSVTLSPGRMGPHALPVLPVWYPVADTNMLFIIAGEVFFDRRGDLTTSPYLRGTIPLCAGAEVVIFSSPVEYFSTSEAVRHSRGAEKREGFSSGDVYVQILIPFLREKEEGILPVVGCASTLKTTTGKGLRNARHIDAPAYYFDVAIGKLFAPRNRHLRLRLATTISFLAWQTGIGQQNDALGYGMRASICLKRTWEGSAECAGYIGWQNNGDRPAVLRFEIRRVVTKAAYVFCGLQFGLHDQVDYSLKSGVCFGAPLLFFSKRRF